jgi:putative tricarboxylic transport membrane protein
METLQHIYNGFSICLQPINVWYTFIGVLMGTVIGVLPGIGPSAGIALLIPVTFGMNPTSALIMMAGIYYGAQYGGSTTSILINTPGESSSVMTAIDGNKMAKKGRAGAALAISAWGSFIAGTLGVVALTLLAVPLTAVALKFGPAEYFTLMFFAMTAVSSLSGKSPAKGMLSTMLGLMISTVGIDLQSGEPRYTMGILELQDGVGFLLVVVGMFAVGEVFSSMEDYFKGKSEIIRIKGKLLVTKEEWKRSVMPILRGGVIGFFIGVLPGAGATIATIMSYTTEKRISKHPEQFGEGAIEGVAGPESANNASTAGALVPLLTLGVPGSGSTAVLLGAFIMYGIQPGPLLFQSEPGLVWGLVDSMYIGNMMLLILNLPLIGIFVRLLYIPTGILLPLIMAFATIGIYSVNGDTLDLYIALLLFGALGYIFRKVEIPAAPLVLALVLGGMMEQSFRQALTISDGNPVIFVSSGTTVTLVVLSIISIALPFVLPRIRRWKEGSEDLNS